MEQALFLCGFLMSVDTSGESRKIVFFILLAIPMLLLYNVQ